MAPPNGRITQTGDTLHWTHDGYPPVRVFGEARALLKDRALPARVQAFMTGMASHEAAARQRLVERYYDLWVDAWSHGFDGTLTREEFAQHLSGPRVSYPDGQYVTCFTISYDPGTLFGDHWLYVAISADGTIIDDGMM